MQTDTLIYRPTGFKVLTAGIAQMTDFRDFKHSCIVFFGSYNVHYRIYKDRPTNALSCTFLLLFTMAATCFGKTMPSSGSDWVPAELLQGSMC
jgi:hypothetical protein